MLAPQRIQRFEVIDHLGSGGMGSVFRARDPQLERDVAIKLLLGTPAPGELSFSETVDLRSDVAVGAEDLLREARMMARLSHPNVLPVYEVGLSDGAVFLVMEHIDGTDLSSWLVQPRSTEAILDVFRQAAQGLLAAHERGIVHRDIKPANILIGADGRVRVADFGLSRLTDRPQSMVRVAEGGGTPYYMAPELWRGDAATTQSDVFALCTALLDALGAAEPGSRERTLRERGIRPRLREVLRRGVAVDPAVRPDVGQLIGAIEDRARRWRVWAVAAVAACAAAVGGLLALPGAVASVSVRAPACEADQQRLVPWSPGRPAELRVLLAGGKRNDAGADRVVADLEAYRKQVEGEQLGACRAARAGEISESQRQMRVSCLDRRGFELAGTVDFLAAAKPTLVVAREALSALKPPAECVEMIAPPIAGDRDAVEELWRRYARSRVYAVPERVAEQVAELGAIEKLAVESGESELAATAARWLSIALRFGDNLEQADQALARAHRIANELRMSNLAARVLVDRTSIAYMRGDAAAARSYGELARDIADRPTTQPATRAAVYCALGRAALTRDEAQEAIRNFQHALDLLRTTRTIAPPTELACRYSFFEALQGLSSRPPGTPVPLDLARETAEYARTQMGEQDTDHGLALTQVARALVDSGERAEGIEQHRKGLDIIRKTMPAGSSRVIVARARLAYYLYDDGKLAAVRDELAQLVADIETNESVRSQRPTLRAFFALVTFELGRIDEGHALALQALEDAIALLGADHDHTLQLRAQVATLELEMGSTRSAARHLAALERVLQARPDAQRAHLAGTLPVLRAELAIQQGNPRAAETTLRALLREARDDDSQAALTMMLGHSLLEQGKHARARRTLMRSLARARAAKWRVDKRAVIEARIAVAEARLGRRAAARARARRIRKVLAGTGHLTARADVDSVLSRRSRRSRR
jgi:tetratricopeptide (TPR) repeat protein